MSDDYIQFHLPDGEKCFRRDAISTVRLKCLASDRWGVIVEGHRVYEASEEHARNYYEALVSQVFYGPDAP